MRENLLLFATLALIISSNTCFAQTQSTQNILNNVEIDSLTFFVKQLTGEEQVIIGGVPDTIYSRQALQPGNEKAFQFVKEKFLGYGLQVDSMQFNANGKNLFGIKIGTQFPNQKFILGAHYDNIGNSMAPGADDNASGTAAIIEAARIFSNYNFPYTVIFALWDEEELGLLGSKAYATMAASNNEQILGYINMDMLGWDGNNDSVVDLHVRPVASSLLLANKVIEADSIYEIGLRLHIVNPGSVNTDHAPFWDNGFTAIGLNEEYDNDFNPFWHTPGDSLGQFNLIFYKQATSLVFATLGECLLDTSLAIGINEVTFKNFLNHRIYPNPVIDMATIELSVKSPISININIYDNKGQLVDEVLKSKKLLVGKQHIVWSTSDLKSGNYFYNITINGDKTIKSVGQFLKVN